METDSKMETSNSTQQRIFVGEEVLTLTEDILAKCDVRWPIGKRLEVSAQSRRTALG